jgi:hypothetical protein
MKDMKFWGLLNIKEWDQAKEENEQNVEDPDHVG